MKDLEYKSFEIKSFTLDAQSKEMIITGFACNYGNADAKQPYYSSEFGAIDVSDVLKYGCATKTISERGNRIAFCYNHEIDEPIGKIISYNDTPVGLEIKVRISDAEATVKTKIEEGILKELSIGFVPISINLTKQTDETYIREITEIKIYEISLVTIARNERSVITNIKSDTLLMLDGLIKEEKNESKKYKLLQIKSLFISEPPTVLAKDKPTKSVNSLNSMFN
jgi:HK97 family phage prohead protease